MRSGTSVRGPCACGIPRNQATGLPGHAAFSPDGRVLAIATNAEAWCNSSTPSRAGSWRPSRLRNRKTSPSLGFSPDGRLLVVVLGAAGIQVWDLGAIRRELESLGLDWPTATDAGPAASPMLIPEQIVVEDAPWIDPWRGAKISPARVAGTTQPWPSKRRSPRGLDTSTPKLAGCFSAGLGEMGRPTARRAGNSCRLFECVRACAACRQQHRMGLLPRGRGRRRLLAGRPARRGGRRQRPHVANRLNTLGAVLYRAGRFEEAVRQLKRSVEVHGAGGTPYDALFLAMAHHQLGHADQARRWLRLGTVRRSHRHERSGAATHRGFPGWSSRFSGVKPPP